MAGETEIAKLVVRLRAETGELKKEIQEAKGTIHNFVSDIKKTFGAIGIGIGLASAINQMKELVKRGVEYNSQVEQQVLGIASLIAATGDVLDAEGKRLEGMEKLNSAIEISRDLYDQLRLKAMESTATTQELVDAFQMMVAPGREANLTLEQMVNLSRDIVQAMKAMGLPLIQSRMEMRGLLTGEENLRMDIMQRLQIEGEVIKQMRAQGKLYEYLTERLSVFRLAGEKQLTTWEGMRTTIKDIFDMLLAKATAPVFEALKGILSGLIKDLTEVEAGTVKFTATAQGMADMVKNSFKIIIEHFKTFKDEYAGALNFIAMLFKGLHQWVMGFFTGLNVIFSSAVTVIYYFIEALNIMTGKSIPLLKEGAETLKKKMNESWESTIKQADALNELIFGTKKYAEEVKKVPKPTAPPRAKPIEDEKEKKAYEKLIQKIKEYEVAITNLKDPIEADRQALQNWIEEQTKEITITPRVTEAIGRLKETFEKLQDAIREKKAMEDYINAFEKIIEKAEDYKIELLRLKDPLQAEREEFERTIEKITKGVTPTETLSGAINILRQRFNELKDAEMERESVKYRELDIRQRIADIQMQEKLMKIDTEEALRREIDLTNELLSLYVEQIEKTKYGTDAYLELQENINQTRMKLNELNHELFRQTATFEQLTEIGMKKYAQTVKDNLITSFEKLLPNAIDSAGNAFTNFILNLQKGTMSAGDALKKFATDFMDSLTRMVIELTLVIAKMEILKALGYQTGMGGGGGGGKGAGFFSSILGFLSSILGAQTGGRLPGTKGEPVPVVAHAGEFVQPTQTVDYYGIEIMEAIRKRLIPRSILSPYASSYSSMERGRFFQSGGVVSGEKEPITIVNIVDPVQMDQYLSSPRGQNAIINVISQRTETIRKILQ